MSINQRIQRLVDELHNGNKRAFATSIGVSPTVIENIIGTRQGNPSFDVTVKILFANENISSDWLMLGKGDMLKKPTSYKQEEENKIVAESDVSIYKLKTDYFGVRKQNIPLYEIDASAGLSNLFNNQMQQVPIDYITIPNAPSCDGAVYVRGDSMYPILKSGDIACYKMIFDVSNIYFGEMYLLDIDVEGDQYLTFKYVQKSELGEDYVLLVSHNGHHSPKDILKKSIRAMGLVKLSIRYNSIS